MNQVPPILVVACGNAFAGADAFGALVLQALAGKVDPGVQLLDLGMNPTTLLDHLPGRRLLIIVDAALRDDTPMPALLDIDYFSPERPALLSQRTTSTHAMSIVGQLELARALGMLPRQVRLIAAIVEPHQADDIQTAQAQIPQAVQAVVQWTHPSRVGQGD
jgi:hydrogenase maturation protease